jgi:hypothetical protein
VVVPGTGGCPDGVPGTLLHANADNFVDMPGQEYKLGLLCSAPLTNRGNTMNTNLDLQKPIEAVQALMAMQAEAISKSIELQKKAGEQLMAFFAAEAEKAKGLKNPEELIKFSVDANTALFNLMKGQGEAFTALATEASNAAMAQMQKLGK